MKTDRLLSIILMLINRPQVTAKELSEKFEVSIRTIYRDIESISAAGIPVVSWQGKKGGFCLMENYRIDRQMLTINDMISILMALKGISTTLDDGNIGEAIEKIESLVPDDKRELINRRFEHIIIDLAPWGNSAAQKEKLVLIQQALSEQKLIQFSYRNLKGEALTRVVEPMSLILKTNSWYLYGYCRNRKDFRIFRFSRIYDSTILDSSFSLRNHPFNSQDFFNDQRAPVDLVLRFPSNAKSIVEEFYSGYPSSKDEYDRITVKVSFPEDEWVYSMILSHGPECEVLSPAHIRELIQSRLKKAWELYK